MRKISLLLSTLFILLILSTSLFVPTSASTLFDHGTLGTVTWDFYPETCTIVFSGEGDIPCIYYANTAWGMVSGPVKTIVIEEGITSVGINAFYYYKYDEITSVTLPSTLQGIGDYAFGRCRNLTSINIPSSVRYIGKGAFQGCKSLESFIIPNGITEIKSYTFAGCSSLTDITVPDSIISIAEGAFNACYSLTDISLPDGITSIGKYAFLACESLESITLPNKLESINYGIFNKTKLKSLRIPTSVKKIEFKALFDCNTLSEIVYCGSTEEWNAIEKGEAWCQDPYNIAFRHHCYKTARINDTSHSEYCVYCNDRNNASPDAPHVWNDGENTVEPTHITYGKRIYACVDCGETREESLDPIPHSFGEWQKGPFNHSRVCSCGYSEQQAHTYKNESDTTCEICGAKQIGSCDATVSGGLALLLLCSGAAVMIRKKDQI